MGKLIKGLGYSIVGLIVLAGLGYWAIGPDWRALLKDPPSGNDVLFWSQGQREAGFRMMDKIPMIIQSRKIPAGDQVLEFGTGEPLDLGMDMDALMEELNHAALVIIQDGKIRLEKYGLGFGPEGRWTSFSVAKSLTSTLVGAAIKDGYIESLDDKVSDYIEGLQGSPYDDVAIHELLTMTSGVGWNEDYEDPNSDVANFLQQVPEGDEAAIVTYMKGLSRAHPPGEVWNYSTGETNLIGVLVNEATGRSLAEYLSEKVWAAYGMQQDASWLIGPDEREISGCCIQAATRDFARFGQFIMDGAMIDGESIVPDGYLDLATSNQTHEGDEGYGYQWWITSPGTFEARGIFGQGIFIDPGRRLIIASNSNWTTAIGYRDGEGQRRAEFYRAVQAAIDSESAN